MALTVTPAVSRGRDVVLQTLAYFAGIVFGSLVSVTLVLLIYEGLQYVWGRAWTTAMVSGAIAWALLHDLGLPLPLPYRNRQVPERLRDALPLGAVAFCFGVILGCGFLTLFTYSVHVVFLLGLPLLDSAAEILLGITLFALGKSVVIAATATVVHQFRDIAFFFIRSRLHLQMLRYASALYSAAAAVALLAG